MDLKDLFIGTVIRPDYSCKSNRKAKIVYELLSASFQDVRRLFALAYFVAQVLMQMMKQV